MKHLLSIVSFVLFFGLSQSVTAQDCKVLVPELDSIYTGKCKKGLAHGKGTAIGKDTYTGKFAKGWPSGKGTYTWSSGDHYTGEWKQGKRHGEGKLIVKLVDRDSIVDGLWENDIYMGPKPKAPKVITKYQVERYSFRKAGGVEKRVLINFILNGSPNTTLTNLSINAPFGDEITVGTSRGLENIVFPVTIRISYETMNKVNTNRYNSIFEFEITDPGDWVVDIYN